jgi:flavin reductase (DIM6/NTAB) family NADH-FMN oxidoreductase RutF
VTMTTSEPRVRTLLDDSMQVHDHLHVRKAFAHFPSGVVVLAVQRGGLQHALVASSFMVGVSLDPCLVALAVQKTSETWPAIRQSETFGLSVFSQSQGGLVRQLAGADREARFDGIPVAIEPGGAILVEDAALWFECSLHSELDAGDHWMLLLQARRMGLSENEPIVWHGAGFRAFADRPRRDEGAHRGIR